MFIPRRPFGSGIGDHALPYRYPLSLGTPIMKEGESGLARRLALEIKVLDGHVARRLRSGGGPEGVRSRARRQLPLSPRGGRW
jgi:hypothetical protein